MPIVYYQDDVYERGCNESYPVCGEIWEYIQGNAIDIEVHSEDSEIRADIIVNRKKAIRVCGQIRDCSGRALDCALVKLLKPSYIRGKLEYESVAYGVTDSRGYYEFNICDCTMDYKQNSKFRILVSKDPIE